MVQTRWRPVEKSQGRDLIIFRPKKQIFRLRVLLTSIGNMGLKVGEITLILDKKKNLTLNSFICQLFKCDPSREKGRVGCHIVKFTFSAF